MKLAELIKDLHCEKIKGNTDKDITGLSAVADSTAGGDLFICYKGVGADGHDYADKAVKNGAAAIVCERELDTDVTQIIVTDGRAAMATLARTFYGRADEKLKIVAVTGTNGKTTTTY
ncbi:MAG: UDP-N-acetylmuramoyl-L-alanyl-D-glutamate--2,6-diaminopimelate ligase, partial [Clostridia bacterium]|nr:UDP-N-acetylmuramoyl-L-alanyl-D-glutamate--2,6-diaminopimelate ligase [Clostridia bacterium]